MPPPSVAKRQIKRLRSSGYNPFLVSLKQFPTGSLYASSPVSKREAPEALPSSDDLRSVIFELEEEPVIDNEMDVDLRLIEDEGDIFSD